MKTPLLPLAAAVLALLAAGCTTADPTAATAARIQEKSDAFAKLSPELQKSVRSGTIERGYSTDMVYMALGRPAKVKARDGSLGKLEMWTYFEFAPGSFEAKDNRNHPGAAGYTPESVSSMDAHGPDPLFQPGLAKVAAGSFNGTAAAMGPLHVPDMKVSKLYVFFANGRVAEIKYDSEGT